MDSVFVPERFDSDPKEHRRKIAAGVNQTGAYADAVVAAHAGQLNAHTARAILYGFASSISLNTTISTLTSYSYLDVQGDFDANASLGEITLNTAGVFDIVGSVNGLRTGTNVGQEVSLILRLTYGDPAVNIDTEISVLQVAVHSSGRFMLPFLLTTWFFAEDKLSIGLKATADMGTYTPEAVSFGVYQLSDVLPIGATR